MVTHDPRLDDFIQLSEGIRGWTRGEEARELARISFFCSPRDLISSRSAVFLAPARYCWRGRVGCEALASCIALIRSIALAICSRSPIINGSWPSSGGGPIRCLFERNIRNARVDPWVQIHQGRAAEIARNWAVPIDLLYLDGDQVRAGAREALRRLGAIFEAGRGHRPPQFNTRELGAGPRRSTDS